MLARLLTPILATLLARAAVAHAQGPLVVSS